MFRRLAINVALVLGSALVGLALVEVYLNLTGRYENLVNGASVVSGSTIWTTQSNKTVYRNHPDLGYPVKEVLDDHSTRNEGAPYVLGETGPVVGIFGDSFTENTNLEQQYTFIDLLNKYYGKNLFWNFGVDGFGAEQSFQRYMNVSDQFVFSDVVYVFCHNDLQNTYQVELLDIADGPDGLEFANVYEGASVPTSLTRLIGQLRISYLVLEAYYQARAMLGGTQTQDQAKEENQADIQKKAKARQADVFSSKVEEDFMSDSPSAEALAVGEKLRKVILLWKQEVERRGARFHIAVLPFQQSEIILNKILSEEERKEFGVFYLRRPRETPVLSQYAVQFYNDGHWSEIGNLAVIQDFISHFASLKPAAGSDLDSLIQTQLDGILALYNKYGQSPRTKGW